MDESKTIGIQKEEHLPPAQTISFLLNQQPVKIEVAPTFRLVDILRDELKQTGTKISCGIGRCGACSVLMDGRVVNSCLLMAYQAAGSSITTIEGVNRDPDLHPIQQVFLEEGGFQCGYCTSGMIIAVKAMIDVEPKPSDDQIKEALSGNLCRCTGYGGIIRAVRRLAESGI